MGTKQGHWDVKEALLDPSEDYRTSLYGGGGVGTGRDSVYDASSVTMDYQPQMAPAQYGQQYQSQQQQQNQNPPQLQYQSQQGPHYSSSRDRLSQYGSNGGGNMIEGRLPQYGDIRRQLASYDDYPDSQTSHSQPGVRMRDREQDREREYAY